MVHYEPVLSEERQYYDELEKLANPSGSETFATKELVAFLQSSKLGVADLRAIWNFGADGASEIKRVQVDTMLRCIGLIQAGIQLSADNIARNRSGPLPLPKFEIPGAPSPPSLTIRPTSGAFGGVGSPSHSGASRPSTPASVSGASAFETASVSGSVTGYSWAMSSGKRSQYEDLFHKQKLVDGKLEGKEAMEFFLKSKMPWDQLREVLRLADLDKDLKLSLDEFCIAMHMVLCITRKNFAMPSEVPQELLPNQPRSAPLTSADAVAAATAASQPDANHNFHMQQQQQDPLSRQGSQSHMSDAGSNSDAAHPSGFPTRAAPVDPHASFSSAYSSADVNPSGSYSGVQQNQQQHQPQMTPEQPIVASPAGPSEEDVANAAATNEALGSAVMAMSETARQQELEKQRIEEVVARLSAERDRLVEDLKTATEDAGRRQEELKAASTDMDLLRETVAQLRLEVAQQKEEIHKISVETVERLAEKMCVEHEKNSLKEQLEELQNESESIKTLIANAEVKAAEAEAEAKAARAAEKEAKEIAAKAAKAEEEAKAKAAEAEREAEDAKSAAAKSEAEANARVATAEAEAEAAKSAAAESAAAAAAAVAAANTPVSPPTREAPTRSAPTIETNSVEVATPVEKQNEIATPDLTVSPVPHEAEENEPPVPESVGDAVQAGSPVDAPVPNRVETPEPRSASPMPSDGSRTPPPHGEPPKRRAPTREAPSLSSPPAPPSANSSLEQPPATVDSNASDWNSIEVTKPTEDEHVDSSAFDEAFDGDADPFEEASTTQPASDVATAGDAPTMSTTATASAPSKDMNTAFTDAGFEETFDFDKKN